MSEGIWINVFMVFCGLWMALIFVFIGVVIERARVDYRSYKSVLRGNTGADVCVHAGIRDRADVQHIHTGNNRELGTEEMIGVINVMRVGASGYERLVLDAIRERIEDEE